jgi:hypothetical protein
MGQGDKRALGDVPRVARILSSNTVTILALAVFSLPDRPSRLELFTYCGRFRASGSGPEAWTVSRLSEQRRPLDLL